MFKFIGSVAAAAVIGLGASNLFINDVAACGGYGDWWNVKVEESKKAKDADVDEVADEGETKTSEEEKKPVVAEVKPKIQIAILLDTSGSMDGLIDQARTQLWKIVNEFATVKQAGLTPDVEVALYEYGNDGLPAAEGYLRMVVPLTTDLDKLSEELFALTTNGGSEFCGHVIKSAVEGLQWSSSSNDYKAVFIAGNEEFTQGQVAYLDSCKAAIEKGIVVNTIHCGDYETGVGQKWLHGAQLADGSYMAINSSTPVVHIASPHDEEIIKLGEELNETYVPYGKEGEEGATRQAEQDSNANGGGQGANVNRALSKKNHTYRNDAWDLVDALKEEKVKLEDLKKEDLPEELRDMTNEELKKHLDGVREKRAELTEKLNELEKKRNAHVAEKRREASEGGEETLDEAMIKAIREQAEKKKFKREEVKEEKKED
ncbi:MAG: VWA domain-containing protein [Planctomycetes bacterium]|nr:VWA domain-containing protein [Planctomycetota bacterium]